VDTALVTALVALVSSAPNLVVAIWMLFEQNKRIDMLLAEQRELISKLMALHPPQDVVKPL